MSNKQIDNQRSTGGILSGTHHRCALLLPASRNQESCGEIPEAGVQENTVMRFGQRNEAPGARFVVGHATFAIAEYTFGTTTTGIFYIEENRILMKNTGRQMRIHTS